MRDPALRRRSHRRAARRLAIRALVVPLLLALGLAPYWPPAASPAEAQATTPTAPPQTPPRATPTPGPTPFPGSGPPAGDPAGPPSAYTLSRADQLFVTRTQQWPDVPGPSAYGSTYTFSSDVTGVTSFTPFADAGVPAGAPSWPLLPVRGRFTDPGHEQALLLNQANDCLGPGACTYTLFLGQAAAGTAGEPVVPTWIRRVQGDGDGSPVAVAAADLDGRVSVQGFPNDEVAVASRNPDGTLRVDVLDYNAAPGDAVETAPTVALPAIGTSLGGAGSLGVGVGDFDSDGQNEIAVLWQGAGCAAAAPACLSVPHLSVLRYSNDGRTRSLAVLQADVPLPAALVAGSPAPDMAFQTAVDDFDAQGRDLLAVSYVEKDATLAVLGFARGDPAFTVSRFGLAAGDFTKQAYCPDAGCSGGAAQVPPQLAAGLFWYDEQSGHGLGRRQLAQAALQTWTSGSGGELGLQFYDVGFDASTCVQSQTPQSQPPCPLTLTGLLGAGGTGLVAFGESAASTVVPTVSLAAGSFQGLVLNPSNPNQVPWVVAVGYSGLIGSTSQASASVDYYRISGALAGQFTATRLFQSDQEPAATAPRLLAYDAAGASLVLGAPVVFTMTGNHVPAYILQDPPKHLDWFYDPQAGHGSWLNVDRSDSLSLQVTDTTTTTYASQTDTTTSWTIGASTTVNVTGSFSAGLAEAGQFGGGLSASASVGGSYDHNHDWYTANSSSYSLSTEEGTTDDDLLSGTMRTWQVFRYPIVNYALRDTNNQPVLGPGGQSQYGFYEITVPGSTVPFGPGEGTDFSDWYQPLHQNGNALSYPALDTSTNVVELDSIPFGPPVTLQGSAGASGTPTTLPQPLVNDGYMVDRSKFTVDLSIAQTSGGGNNTTATGTLSESVDADAGAYGSFDVGVAKGSACADVDLKLNNTNSWGSLNTSSNSTTSTNTFAVQQKSAAQGNWAYRAATAYYTDTAGTYRAVHGVDILAAEPAGGNWKTYYGGRPDPALNLPQRMQMTANLQDGYNDIPNWNNADARQQIRGFFVLRPDAAHGGQTGSLSAGAPAFNPVDGDTLQLQVRVHNYSVDTAANAVPVEFWAVPRNFDDRANAGPPVKLATVTLDSIPALGWVPANYLWDTSGTAPTGAQVYRIFVVVARNDPTNPNDPWNNVVHAWADRYDDPATVDGTPSTDRLTDPLTGQYETLEAGQNKQGWFEVTISPKRPAPGPLAATAPAPAPPEAQLRFGSGGVGVTPPRAGLAAAPGAAAASTAAVTADRAQEVRAHLAATALGGDNSVCANHNNSATLMVYEGAPEQGGRLVGMKRVTGLVASGPAGRWVTLPWTPRTAGRRQLVFRLHGSSMDPRAAPAETTVDVDVAPPPEAPATLGRLLEVLRVAWLPADLRAALVAQVQAANAAALAGDQPGARAALTALKAQTAAAEGNTVATSSASRIGGLADALLAQSAIAADCLPASAAQAAAGTPGTPGPTATPAGALPPCEPGTATGTATPTATGTPATATPTPAGTGTPRASVTPGTPTPPAGGTGTQTPPAAGSPTPSASGSPTPAATATSTPAGTPSPTAQRTATPATPPPVVPPPLTPPPAGTVAPAAPPRASDGQHLGLQAPEVQAAFRATHGDAAEARWAAEHEAELARRTP